MCEKNHVGGDSADRVAYEVLALEAGDIGIVGTTDHATNAADVALVVAVLAASFGMVDRVGSLDFDQKDLTPFFQNFDYCFSRF